MHFHKNVTMGFSQEDSGQSLIEYSLIAGLIALACVVGLTKIGQMIPNLLMQFYKAFFS